MNVFSWDIAKAIANFEKHGVPFEEATTVFANPNAIVFEQATGCSKRSSSAAAARDEAKRTLSRTLSL